MGFNPTFQQAQLLQAIQDGKRRIAVRSGQGPGKTTASAVVGGWLMLRDPYCRVVVTAPTMKQCKDVWLAEFRNRLREGNPSLSRLFHVTNTQIGVCGNRANDWGCLLVTSNKPENAQGQHNKNLHLICEEASGIPREIIEQYEGTLTNPGALFLQVGNPNTRDCAFFDSFHKDLHRWTCLHWNAEETPESEWFSHSRNELFAEKFGRDSDAYRIRVLGEFPLADPDCLMSDDQVRAVMGNKRLLVPSSQIINPAIGRPAKQFGLDFARYGGDESTVYRRQGNAVMEWQRYSHIEPADVARSAFEMQRKAFWSDRETHYAADAGGMGQGVMHVFYEARKNIHEFHNGARAHDIDYDNKITEAYFNVARLVKERQCYLPHDEVLLRQLTTRRYFTTKKGKLSLESKDDYIKRGFESPDRADGLAVCLYDQIIDRGGVAQAGSSRVPVGALPRERR
jgi:phage terminase large subunit